MFEATSFSEVELDTENSQEKFSNQGTYKLIPYGKNQVIARFENLADRFDSHSSNTSYFNVQKFANRLYKDVNGAMATSIEIDELSLSGNMREEDRQAKELAHPWKGQDDGTQLPFNNRPSDIEGFKGVAMEPQRIRTFLISYNQKKEVVLDAPVA